MNLDSYIEEVAIRAALYKRYKGKKVSPGDPHWDDAAWYVSKRIDGRLINRKLHSRTEEDALSEARMVLHRNKSYKKRKAQDWPGFVYLLHAEGTLRYKIGFATRPNDRRMKLDTGSPFPLRLLSTVPGDKQTEQEIHVRLKRFRVHKEWFELADDGPLREVFGRELCS